MPFRDKKVSWSNSENPFQDKIIQRAIRRWGNSKDPKENFHLLLVPLFLGPLRYSSDTQNYFKLSYDALLKFLMVTGKTRKEEELIQELNSIIDSLFNQPYFKSKNIFPTSPTVLVYKENLISCARAMYRSIHELYREKFAHPQSKRWHKTNGG